MIFVVQAQIFVRILHFLFESFEFFLKRLNSKLKLWFVFTGLVSFWVLIFHKTLEFPFSILRLLLFSFRTFSFPPHRISFEHQQNAYCRVNVLYVTFRGFFKHFFQSCFIWATKIDLSFCGYADQFSKVSWKVSFDTEPYWSSTWFHWDHNLRLSRQSWIYCDWQEGVESQSEFI